VTICLPHPLLGVISGSSGWLFIVEPLFDVTNQRAIVLDGEQLLQ